MPGRKFSSGSGYRYGFNGQEKSDEIAAGLTTAMYWEYDSRIGRRWNLDPVPKIGESEYACFGNNPIYLSDPSGNQPDPPGKNSTKGYDYGGALRASCIHFLAARVAYFTYEVRAERGQYNWKLNNAYRQAAENYSATRYQEDNVAGLGINQADFAKIVSQYYIKFEKAFNYAADETMKELKFIYYNKFDNARDIFKPNLTTNEASVAISQTNAMLDDMCDGTYTIGAKWQEVIDKCFMFAAAWSSSGIGSGVLFSSSKVLGLQPPRAPIRTDPQMPHSISLKYADPQPNGVNLQYTVSEGKLSINGRSVTNGNFDYVITNSGELRIGSGHYYLSGGAQSVQAAGRLKIHKGKVTPLNGNSGHYRPTPQEIAVGNELLKKTVNGGN